MRTSWGNLGIVIALVVLAASIFFGTLRISQTVTIGLERAKRSMEETQEELTQETRKLTQDLRQELRRDAIVLVYALRKASTEDRPITKEDLEKGNQFADMVVVPSRERLSSD